MSVCVTAGAVALRFAATAFTLGWTHSVERLRWEEDWRVTPAGLEIAEARVRGSGAGMEPGQDAAFRDGWWRWRPPTPPVADLVLAASGATGGGWELCVDGGCRSLGAAAGPPVRIAPCAGP